MEASGDTRGPNALGGTKGPSDSIESGTAQGNDFLTFSANGRAVGSILLDLSHGPYSDYPIATRYSSFITALQGWGFTVTVANDFANLQDYDVVLFSFPQSSFTSAQVNRVRDYMDAGGILIIFADWGPNPERWSFSAVNGLLYDLQSGISIASAKVIDPLNYYLHEFWIWIRDFSGHCLTRNVSEVLALATNYVQLGNPASALFFSSSDSYLEIGGAPGPFPIAGVADPEANPDWRLFVLPDTNMFCTDPEYGDFFNMADHRQLAENIVFWCPCQSSAECDDGLFCNGVEYCDELSRQCVSPGDPCTDDGLYCTGAESCDEEADLCVHSGDPCTDDGIFCNGVDVCDEVSDSCVGAGKPCVDDGFFCNGVEACNEDLGGCFPIDIPCQDDGLWCNGTEICDENADQCRDSDPPCDEDEYCDEALQLCIPGDDDDNWVPPGDDDDPDGSLRPRPDTDDKDDGNWWPLGDLSGGCCGC